MSLINILKKNVKETLFTTPSHSQSFCIFPKLKQFYKYDISENEAYNPQIALDLAQKKAAEIYGTKSTYFLTNGSTCGIIAAVLACVCDANLNSMENYLSSIDYPSLAEGSKSLISGEGISRAGLLSRQLETEKVLIWDNAHSSHANAVKLAGATPIFYQLEKDEDWGIYTATSPEKMESVLKKEEIKAVVVTSPTYEGIVSDIKKIKEICAKYGAYLIVDEAHGALYPFCDKLPESAISQGADFVIQSLHKTAGGLNPTALLHCNVDSKAQSKPDLNCQSRLGLPTQQQKADNALTAPLCNLSVQEALDLISTTSPSYPLLASVEKNINYLNSTKGRAMILELIANIEEMKKKVPNVDFYQGSDVTKILIKHPKYKGFELSDILFEKYKIEDERANEKSVMFLCGIGTDYKKLKYLEKVLKKL